MQLKGDYVDKAGQIEKVVGARDELLVVDARLLPRFTVHGEGEVWRAVAYNFIRRSSRSLAAIL